MSIEIVRREELENVVQLFNGNALDYLQAIYQGRIEPEYARMRAADIAIQYESPKLAVVATVDEKSFAALLEAKMRRYRKLEASKQIEAKVEDKPKPVVETKLHLPTVHDRRFRRI